MHMCWQKAQNIFRPNHRELLIAIILRGGVGGGSVDCHSSFYTFKYCLNFPAKNSLILVQFLNVNRGCLSDEIMGHFLVVVLLLLLRKPQLIFTILKIK